MSTFSSSDEATHSSSSVKNDTPPTAAVQTLASSILWPGVEPNRIGVENLEDGESHITFRLSLRGDGRNDGNNGIQEYVLRLPQRGKLIRAVSFLSFLQGYTNIPIAEVVHFDPSPDNAVESPYIIQKHLRGVSLWYVLHDMTHEQMRRLTRELGDITRQLLAVKSSHAGYLEQKPGQANSDGDEVPLDLIVPFETAFVPGGNTLEVPYQDGPVAMSTHQLLKGLFDRQRERMSNTAYDFQRRERALKDHRDMSWDLFEGKWLDDIDYCPAHLDIRAARIWVNLKAEPGQPIITGLTGWNNAVIGPSFLCCRPPVWLWLEEGEGDDDDSDAEERIANNVPTTEESRELKTLYEEAAGPEYMRFAYGKPYRLGRKLVKFAISGIPGSREFYKLDAMLNSWDELPKQERVNEPAVADWDTI